MGGMAAFQPVTNRAMAQMRDKMQAAVEAKRQVDLKAIEEAEKTAATAAEKAALASQREALEVQPKGELPLGMDPEKMGLSGGKVMIYYLVDSMTALVLNVLLLAAGIGLVGRRMWGIRLAMATAAAKIVRLVLLYSFVVVAIIPPIAQGIGKLAFEAVLKQPGMGAKPPPMLNAAFFTKMYYVMFTIPVVAMMIAGSIYPAISLWFLSRPGARAACEPRSRDDRRWSETRVLGITNVVFASCLMLFGLGFAAYIAILPVVGRAAVQFQKKMDAQIEAQQKVKLEALAEDEAKATTADEKAALAEQRKAIESSPKPPNPFATFETIQISFGDPRIRAYYWVELSSGLLLNVAMIAAGIGLLRRRPWGITLGVGTAAAKVLRLVLVYGYFVAFMGPVVATKTAEMMGKMLGQQQAILGGAAVGEVDAEPFRQLYSTMYPAGGLAFIVLGSIYPVVSLWLLLRARREPRMRRRGRRIPSGSRTRHDEPRDSAHRSTGRSRVPPGTGTDRGVPGLGASLHC